jgi:hypothetical protein
MLEATASKRYSLSGVFDVGVDEEEVGFGSRKSCEVFRVFASRCQKVILSSRIIDEVSMI